ncbi:MAG: hypothetical protein U0992_15815 [Planctomycetaceae bacterium]
MSAARTFRPSFIGIAWFGALLLVCVTAMDIASSPAPVSRAGSRDRAAPHDRSRADNAVPSRGITGRDIARIAPAPAAATRAPLTAGQTTQPTAVARPVSPAPSVGIVPSDPTTADRPPQDGNSERTGTAVPSTPRKPPRGILPLDPPTIEVVPSGSLLQGQPANFTIRLQNPNSAMLHDVAVTARFGEQWEFDDSDVHVVEMRLGDIDARSSREVELSLTPLTSGPGTIDLVATVEQQPAVTATTAADVRPRVIDCGLAGPESRGVGQRAEFLVSLVNASGHDLPDVRVDLAYDPAALAVREASAGGRHAAGSAAWPLGTLLRDERVQIQIEFECTGEARQSPLDCQFASEGRAITKSGARLDILPAPMVEIAVFDPDDPFCVGGVARFQIRVRNRSGKPLDDLELRLTTSPHFEQLHVTTEPAAPQPEMRTDAFAVELRSKTLAPDGELTFEVTATPVLAGDGVLRILARTAGVPAPFEVTESAVVNPPAATGLGEITPARPPTGPSP